MRAFRFRAEIPPDAQNAPLLRAVTEQVTRNVGYPDADVRALADSLEAATLFAMIGSPGDLAFDFFANGANLTVTLTGAVLPGTPAALTAASLNPHGFDHVQWAVQGAARVCRMVRRLP
jgi:hypothetical protein